MKAGGSCSPAWDRPDGGVDPPQLPGDSASLAAPARRDRETHLHGAGLSKGNLAHLELNSTPDRPFPRIKFEQPAGPCMLHAVSKRNKLVALSVLVLWGLAAMHCRLEAVPGFGFLKSCCFLDSASASQEDCKSDACGEVEDGVYRVEERKAVAPQPLLLLALAPLVVATPVPEPQAHLLVDSPPWTERPNAWQFSQRAALSPRAPSIAR